MTYQWRQRIAIACRPQITDACAIGSRKRRVLIPLAAAIESRIRNAPRIRRACFHHPSSSPRHAFPILASRMKALAKRCCAALCSVSLLLLAACGKQTDLPGDAYVWQRVWTPPVSQALAESADVVRAWRVRLGRDFLMRTAMSCRTAARRWRVCSASI